MRNSSTSGIWVLTLGLAAILTVAGSTAGSSHNPRNPGQRFLNFHPARMIRASPVPR